jgi:putative peptidoglycan lipid II flippase
MLLAAGAVAGTGIEAAILVTAMVRLGHGVIPRWRGLDPAARDFARQFGGLTLASLIALASGVIDLAMAASIGPGAASAFSYAGKIMVLLSGTAGIVLTFVVLPRLSQLAASGQRSVLRATFQGGLIVSFVGGSMIAAGLALWSPQVVGLLFERGSFDAADTALVAPIQALLALQLPFTLGVLLAVRMLVAVSAAGWVVISALLSVALHVAGNVVLIPILGVNGIALSASMSSVVLCAVLSLVALRRSSKVVDHSA